jgi:peptidoglycan-N-acetylglucosamine deacetylase
VPRVAITVDFEPDCPPYLSSTFRGIEEGAPALLRLFAEAGINATYFTTGQVAEQFPDAVTSLVSAGHELGCHGVTHTAFDTLDESAARWEIEESAHVLRDFAPVTSFRAPYLRFPESYVPLLEVAGFALQAVLVCRTRHELAHSDSGVHDVVSAAVASAHPQSLAAGIE